MGVRPHGESSPSERFRRELDDVLAGVDGEADPLERIGRLGARLILQQALEDGVSEFLGRARYERAIDPVSHRNGYEPRRVITTAGLWSLSALGCAAQASSGSRGGSSAGM
jgi:hypothetical protein